jgi:hypothetical protein
MTISANFPSIAPSLQLNFAQTEQLDPRITFSRPTTATYYNATTSAVAEQNLFTRSQEFDSADWGKTATSVTANSTVAPDGTTTADTVTADGTTGSKLISASNMGAGAAPATARTVSVYAKAGTNNYLQIYFSGDGTPWADFDLSLGTVGSTGSNQTASIVSVGSGWYRCILYTASTTATTCNFAIVSSSSAARAESNSLATTVILWGAQLEQRSTVTAYTATTTAAITNYIPVLLTQQANEARFDHNPTTRESLGLLIEEQRTNLLTYSSAFDNAAWTKTACSMTTSADIAPDGTQTAQLLVESATTASHFINQAVTKAASAITYTGTYYFKAATRTYSFMQLQDGAGNGATVYFNLSTGAISTAATLIGSGFTAQSATITSVGNGWYRCSLTVTSNSATTIYQYAATSTDGSTTSYAGNGYSGIFIWGAQLEAGAFATSYIPTVASQVTRSADSASMTGTNFSSWYNISEGTLYAEGSSARPSSDANGVVFSINDNSAANRIQLGLTNVSNLAVRVYVAVNSVEQVSGIGVSTITTGQFAKDGFVYKANDFIASSAGLLSSADTSGSIPTVTQLTIGSNGYATNSILCGTIKKLAYYPIRVSNVQLQSLTGS